MIKKFNKQNVDAIMAIISKYRLIADREKALLAKGFSVANRAMGSGGTGQIKTIKSEVRIQIGHASGKYNYAKCVILEF